MIERARACEYTHSRQWNNNTMQTLLRWLMSFFSMLQIEISIWRRIHTVQTLCTVITLTNTSLKFIVAFFFTIFWSVFFYCFAYTTFCDCVVRCVTEREIPQANHCELEQYLFLQRFHSYICYYTRSVSVCSVSLRLTRYFVMLLIWIDHVIWHLIEINNPNM